MLAKTVGGRPASRVLLRRARHRLRHVCPQCPSTRRGPSPWAKARRIGCGAMVLTHRRSVSGDRCAGAAQRQPSWHATRGIELPMARHGRRPARLAGFAVIEGPPRHAPAAGALSGELDTALSSGGDDGAAPQALGRLVRREQSMNHERAAFDCMVPCTGPLRASASLSTAPTAGAVPGRGRGVVQWGRLVGRRRAGRGRRGIRNAEWNVGLCLGL